MNEYVHNFKTPENQIFRCVKMPLEITSYLA